MEGHSLHALNNLVHNLESLCFSDADNRSIKPFSNFSIHEILKPKFGVTLKSDYDSDSAYTSDTYTSDAWSSCDECCERLTPNLQQNGIEASSDRRTISSLENIKRKVSSSKKEQPFLRWTDRWRHKFEDDGYSSEDSEYALDLRIARKKTPPKTTEELPTWVFCTRYSDRPSAGPRSRRRRTGSRHPRRARTVFNDRQLHKLNIEFMRDQYLSEERRRHLSDQLELDETSIKIWFQNKRAKLKRRAVPLPLAVKLQQQGLYNHKMAPF